MQKPSPGAGLNVVIAQWGSAGDIIPAIAVGVELKGRGHRVTFVGNPHFGPLAAEAGLEVETVGTLEDHRRLTADTDVFDPDKKVVVEILADHYFPAMHDFYETVAKLSERSSTVIIGGELGSMFVAEKFGLPHVSVAPSPGTDTFMQTIRDPVYPERILPAWAGWFAKSARRFEILHRANNLVHDSWKTLTGRHALGSVPEPITRLRIRVGLPSEIDIEPDLALCMWPEWFARTKRGAAVVGFPYYPLPHFEAANGKTRPKPIVVTTGSLAGSQLDFYRQAVAACTALGREAILVTPHRGHIPDSLPPTVTYLQHAPFHELFGRASLVIHHGGIGTASYALAAGVPQIVMPMRGDQFDNGNRVVRLGVGRLLSKNTQGDQLAKVMSALLGSATVSRHCSYWKSRIDPEEGRRRAADCVEELAARHA